MKENDRILKFNIEAAAWAGVWPGNNLAEAASFGARCFNGSMAGCNLEMEKNYQKVLLYAGMGGVRTPLG